MEAKRMPIVIEGMQFDSWSDYYNSTHLEANEKAIYLQGGQRTPQNEEEEKMLQEIRTLESKGYEIDIPFGTY